MPGFARRAAIKASSNVEKLHNRYQICTRLESAASAGVRCQRQRWVRRGLTFEESEAHIAQRELSGTPIQYISDAVKATPREGGRVVSLGFQDAVRPHKMQTHIHIAEEWLAFLSGAFQLTDLTMKTPVIHRFAHNFPTIHRRTKYTRWC